MMSREETLDEVRKQPKVSVLIVGGGVNGIGTFRDLALQGVDVLLVEKNDFCSGASAASSHMLHGGIRYLENGEFRLVREALTERNRMLQNAPHYSKPLATTIPIFGWFSGISVRAGQGWGLVKTRSRTAPFSRFSNRAILFRQIILPLNEKNNSFRGPPGLTSDGLTSKKGLDRWFNVGLV